MMCSRPPIITPTLHHHHHPSGSFCPKQTIKRILTSGEKQQSSKSFHQPARTTKRRNVSSITMSDLAPFVAAVIRDKVVVVDLQAENKDLQEVTTALEKQKAPWAITISGAGGPQQYDEESYAVGKLSLRQVLRDYVRASQHHVPLRSEAIMVPVDGKVCPLSLFLGCKVTVHTTKDDNNMNDATSTSMIALGSIGNGISLSSEGRLEIGWHLANGIVEDAYIDLPISSAQWNQLNLLAGNELTDIEQFRMDLHREVADFSVFDGLSLLSLPEVVRIMGDAPVHFIYVVCDALGLVNALEQADAA